MEELDLLKQFYYHSEQDAKNDFQLGAMNSAYCKIERKLRAFEIIDKKCVKVMVLKNSKTLKAYNECVYKDYELTEDEWKLLKEELTQW